MEDTKKNPTLDPALSRQLHQALTVGKDELYLVLQSPSMEVLRAALRNPALDEAHLLTLLKRRDLSEDLIKAIHKLPLTGESHNLKLALVKNPNIPGTIITTLLPHLYLFELVAVCFLPGVTPDQKLAAERAVIQRIPTTPLGNKLTLARRGTAPVLEALLREGDPQVVEICLSNPQIKEAFIFQFLGSARATAENISMIARHPRWKTRPNIIGAILKNQRTPLIWFDLFLPGLNSAELKKLLASGRLDSPRKKAVEEALHRRRH
ncbi:hypothetical protein [Geotalea toluenoxydans]|uniref:hypothetical protein n=1 Tax=Geotalea toluenoxydans TaxID=421624 RepID=UPI0006CF4F39|nr:hypothetical protein [Geotalea toluenoxydans]